MRRRGGMAFFVLATLAGLISILLIACDGGGDDGGNGGTQTPVDTERTTCKPPSGAAPGTPQDVLDGFAEYQSPERGYRVQYPAEWGVKPNQVAVANMTGDAFFSGEMTGKINPNISITCETIPIEATSGDFIDAKRNVILRTAGVLPEVKQTLTVNGSDAALVEYSLEAVQEGESIITEKIDVYFADDMGGWTIALTAPAGSIENYRAAFNTFVQTFRRP